MTIPRGGGYNELMLRLRDGAGAKYHSIIYGNILAGLSFLSLALITARLLVPVIGSNAEAQDTSIEIGPYTMSMTSASTVSINATPTPAQAIYTGTDNLELVNTCPDGAIITLTTSSEETNSLTPVQLGSNSHDILATTTTSLDNNSWGYALGSTNEYHAVPKKGTTPATIYDGTTAQATSLTIPVKYGVKIDNTIPSGAYSADVVYSLTPKSGCLGYTVIWDMDGGTRKDGVTYPSLLGWEDTVDLSTLAPTRTGYIFTGWTNGTTGFTGSETTASINTANTKTVTMKAKWTKLMAENLEYTPPTGVTCTDAQCMIDYLSNKLN